MTKPLAPEIRRITNHIRYIRNINTKSMKEYASVGEFMEAEQCKVRVNILDQILSNISVENYWNEKY